jgi:hypothetical protein
VGGARIQLGQAQQRIENGNDRGAFPLGPLDQGIAVARAFPGAFRPGRGEQPAQPGQRRAQVVRQGAGKLALGVDQFLHPVEHAVEALGLVRKHAVQPVGGDAPRQVASGNGIGCGLGFGQAQRGLASEQHGGGQAREQRAGKDRHHHAGQDRLEAFSRLAVLHHHEQRAIGQARGQRPPLVHHMRAADIAHRRKARRRGGMCSRPASSRPSRPSNR